MSLVLRKQQMFALMILAFLTILAISYVMLATVAHIDVWHLMTFFSPNVMYGRG